jgi:hypothetical protein
MKVLQHPSFIGALMVGIIFNVLLSLLGALGFKLLGALYLTATLLTIIGAVGVQFLITRSRRS